MGAFWNYQLWGNTVSQWLLTLLIILVCFVGLRVLQAVVVKRIKGLVARTRTTFDDFFISVIQSSVMPLLYVLVIHFALQYLALPQRFFTIEHIAVMLVITFFVLRMVSSFVNYTFRSAVSKHDNDGHRKKQSKGILLIVHFVIWSIGILFLIDNLGYDITTLVAGLGIGGIAIALAAQTVLGDLFSYLVIFFDKPFEIGDFIIVDDKMGTIEYIGIKTTRLKTLNGEQLICSNTDLTNSRVHNYKRMQERRAVFSFGVVYSTPAPKLKMIPQLTRKIIESYDLTRFDRAHFKTFGASSLDFEVVYYILSPEYNTYMNIQQQINLSLFELFQQEGIEFAFPTHTVYVNKVEQEQMYRA